MSLVLYNIVYSEPEYVVPDWGSCTDEELAVALEKHYAGEIDLHEHWKIKDGIVRPLTLTTGEQIELVLMHPTYPLVDGGTAAFVIGMKDCLNTTYAMNNVLTDDTNAGGWNGCDMRTYLNNTVYNQLPNPIKQVLKKMSVWTANGGVQAGTTGVYSEDYLALPAEKEVFGSNRYADSSIESQLFQFDWYKTASNRIKQQDGSNTRWWERSPDSNTYGNFCDVDSSGIVDSDLSHRSRNVSFFCCI